MPGEARRRREAAADGRHVGVNTGQVSFAGTVWVKGEVDLADGLDLDAALGQRAAQLAALGSTECLDVRHSVVLSDLARAQLALDLDAEEVAGGSRRRAQNALLDQQNPLVSSSER